MSGSLNKVILIGSLGKDPEVKSLTNGNKVATFSLATSERWKDKSTGEKKEKTEWHQIVVFNENLVKVAENYLKKGSHVYVEGQIQTRKWQDKDGNDRYATEIVLQAFSGTITMLGGKPDGERSGKPVTSSDERRGGQSSKSYADDLDADIPF